MNDDLISREDLKEAFRKDIMGGLNWKSIIDNAPTVITEEYIIALKNAAAVNEAIKEIRKDEGVI